MISVVIPTYQRLDQLSRCLDRLDPKVQSLAADQYEVIVTDDGREVTARSMIAQRYPRVRWVAGPRRGPAANRNNGARAATGEFIAFTDDDCIPSAQWLSSFAAAICDEVDVYEGKTTCEAGVRSPLEHAPINLTGGCLWSCNMMVRKALFERLGGFDEDFPYPHMEDADFRRRLEAHGINIQFAPEAVVDHPPRRQLPGRRLGFLHECDVVFCRKWNQSPPSLPAALYRIAKVRGRDLLGYRLSAEWFVALGSMLLELGTVAAEHHRWLVKHHPLHTRPHTEASSPPNSASPFLSPQRRRSP
jgi:GT2 family glycosyltransferase